MRDWYGTFQRDETVKDFEAAINQAGEMFAQITRRNRYENRKIGIKMLLFHAIMLTCIDLSDDSLAIIEWLKFSLRNVGRISNKPQSILWYPVPPEIFQLLMIEETEKALGGPLVEEPCKNLDDLPDVHVQRSGPQSGHPASLPKDRSDHRQNNRPPSVNTQDSPYESYRQPGSRPPRRLPGHRDLETVRHRSSGGSDIRSRRNPSNDFQPNPASGIYRWSHT